MLGNNDVRGGSCSVTVFKMGLGGCVDDINSRVLNSNICNITSRKVTSCYPVERLNMVSCLWSGCLSKSVWYTEGTIRVVWL